MRKWHYLLLATCLAVAIVFLAREYRKDQPILDKAVQSRDAIVQGDSQKDSKEALKLFMSAAEQTPSDASIKLRILYKKWEEIEKRYFEIERAMKVEKEEFIVIENKLAELKPLVEEVEKGVEEVLSLENLTAEEKWKAHNLMGCVKMWKILFVQGEDKEIVNKRIQGILRESINSFKQSIDVIEEHKLTGLSTDIPRRNLELLLKRNKNNSNNSSESKLQGEKKEESKKETLQKVMPILSSPGERGGEK